MINSYPESSPTPSVPKPRMRNIIFKTKVFVFNYGQPSNINNGPTPIFYLVDNPPMYINLQVQGAREETTRPRGCFKRKPGCGFGIMM